ncbi:unnamed protein product [Arabidopsis thaliana]|uniref:F-box domain-containing protein n=1 Tax=Arabidopsis thaliana TaxID=3702 RepID=A0A654EHS9_ARATH|nr:unnamed protein product [Arabidopsis thaliana]
MNIQKDDWMDRRKIVRRNTQSSASTYVLEKLHIDLVIEILSRLSAKSIAICRCVSKQWNSLLVSQDFVESFLRSSLSRPRIWFTFRFDGKWNFFSSPQPQKFGNNLSVEATEHHMGSYENWYMKSCQSVHGFIFMSYNSKGMTDRTQVIWNPCTRQLITLPKLEPENLDFNSFFAYDPTEKQFKVLCMTVVNKQQTTSYKYQVLTLGTGPLLWRNIECPFMYRLHDKSNRGICINGVLYFIGWIKCSTMIIICFDVSSEKFSFIKIENAFIVTLINYRGKLGVYLVVYGSPRGEVWVLDDTKNDNWSKHNFVCPYSGQENSTWATGTGELVWPSSPWTQPFYVVYYNLERQSFRRVDIKGMENKVSTGKDRYDGFFTFTNHVENLMVLPLHKKTIPIQDTLTNRVMERETLTRSPLTQTAYASSYSTTRSYKSSGKRCSDRSIGEDEQDDIGEKRGDQAAERRERSTKRGKHEVH